MEKKSMNPIQSWAYKAGQLTSTRAGAMVFAIATAFSVVATGFVAWVSLSAYEAVLSGLPGSQYLAIFFTISIALFFGTMSKYFAGWLTGEAEIRRATWKTALIVAVLLIAVGRYDFDMGQAGAQDRAEQAAPLPSRPLAVGLDAATQAAVAAEQELISGKVGGTGWRDPKTGIFHLNGTGKARLANLQSRIQTGTAAAEKTNAGLDADFARATTAAHAQQARKSGNLMRIVKYVYFIIVLADILTALLSRQFAEDVGMKRAPARRSIPRTKTRPGSAARPAVGFQSGRREELRPDSAVMAEYPALCRDLIRRGHERGAGSEIAREHGVSRQFVSQIKQILQNEGHI